MKKKNTMHAPAERASEAAVEAAAEFFKNDELTWRMADAIPNPLLILNECRQVVFGNKSLLAMVAAHDNQEAIIGLRPGELLNCAHADQSCGGCGTSEFCKECGAVDAILKSQLENRQIIRECHILTRDNSALTVETWATPFEYADTKFTLFAMVDISAEKRRENLEQMLFHDIINAAGGVTGLSELLMETNSIEETRELARTINQANEEIMEDIHSYRMLAAAENHTLKLTNSEQDVLSLLKDVISLYRRHQVANHKDIVINDYVEGVKIITDATLTRRVLGNMLKNALEATPEGDAIIINLHARDDEVEFSVNNATAIPENVQSQIFQRSFSTKAADRGVGTYSMKLFGENYLRGRVWFESSGQSGTTFYFRLPRRENMPVGNESETND